MAVRNEVILPIPLVRVDKQVISQDENFWETRVRKGRMVLEAFRLTVVIVRICRQTPGYRKYRAVKKQ